MLLINFSPFPILETDRLLLRCITPGDAAQLFFLRSDEGIMEFVDREPFKSLEKTTLFIREKILDSLEKSEGILWAIELKSQPGILIGTTGFWRLDKAHFRAEIGYMLHSDYWRMGIMKEAVNRSIDWAFSQTEIHGIEANISPGNKASAALLKSIGFEQEAYFREHYYFNGVFKDSIIFSMVKGIHR